VSTPTVPLNVESFDTMRARFREAIDAGPYDGSEGDGRPGAQPRHVFDFVVGVRLIVSRDLYGPERHEGIHVSASLHDDDSLPIYKEIEELVAKLDHIPRANVAASVIDKTVQRLFAELSGFTGKFRMAQLSPGGVLHYNVPMNVWLVKGPLWARG